MGTLPTGRRAQHRRVLLFAIFGVLAHTAALAQGPAKPGAPLAYVRRLAVAPVFVDVPADPALPPKPPKADKAGVARWERRRQEREKRDQRRFLLPMLVEQTVRERLTRLSGISVIGEGQAGAAPSVWATDLKGVSIPDRQALARHAELMEADAVLALSVGRFGGSGGLQREEWLSATGYLFVKERPGLLGPFRAYGLTRAVAPLIRKLTQKDDETLLRDAAAQAARQVVHFLDTGVEPPFAREVRVAIVPAALPDRVEKRSVEATPEQGIGAPELSTARPMAAPGDKGETVLVAIASLKRQGDVLLQPEIGPVAKVLEPAEITAALGSLGLDSSDLWKRDGVVGDAVARLAGKLQADYVFVSRLRDLDVTDTLEPATASSPTVGLERRADASVEAALFSVAAGRIVWHEEGQGGTVARREVVGGRPRLRSVEQCAVDAARTAYAHLRYRFEEFRRTFER
jgi:hypothetical protein